MEIEKLTQEILEEHKDEVKDAIHRNVLRSIEGMATSWNDPWAVKSREVCHKWFDEQITPELEVILTELKPKVLEQIKTSALAASLCFADILLKAILGRLSGYEVESFIKHILKQER